MITISNSLDFFKKPILADANYRHLHDAALETLSLHDKVSIIDHLDYEIQTIWNSTTLAKAQIPALLDVDGMILQLHISDCMMKAKNYNVLSSFEEYEVLTEWHETIKKEIQNTKSKLEFNTKLQKATRAFLCLSNDTPSLTNESDGELVARLNKLESQLVEIELKLLRHTAGMLCLKTQSMEDTYSENIQQMFDIKARLQSILNDQNPKATALQLLDNLELQMNKQKQIHSDRKKLLEQRVQKDLEREYKEISHLMDIVSKVETKIQFIKLQVDWLQLRQDNLKSKVEMQKCVAFALRSRKQLHQIDKHQLTTLDDQNLSDTFSDLEKLSELFWKKEETWINKSNRLEAKIEGVLKEVHHLTDLATDTDKRVQEKRIDQLTLRSNQLEQELKDQRNTPYTNQDEPTTLSALRHEFRGIISDIQADYHNALKYTLNEKKRLENQLRDAKHERARVRYDRVNVGNQTLFTFK